MLAHDFRGPLTSIVGFADLTTEVGDINEEQQEFLETIKRSALQLSELATDTLTRLYGVPGRAASAIRRFGMGVVGRISPLRDRLMSEARGTSGDLPLLLRGLPI